MKVNDDSSGQSRFDQWKEPVADAVAFAERFPAEVRSGIVGALLSSSAAPVTAENRAPGVPVAGGVSSTRGQGGIAAVARAAGVDVDVLWRFIQLDEDGAVTVRARLGDSRAESQNAYSVVLAYVREKALDEFDTESKLIRAICNEHGCLDRNLAANLRNRKWLLESGRRGGNKLYRLSPAGEQAAREQIGSLCTADGG